MSNSSSKKKRIKEQQILNAYYDAFTKEIIERAPEYYDTSIEEYLIKLEKEIRDLNKRNSRAHGGTRKRYRLARRSRK
jgi:hypothetical protein